MKEGYPKEPRIMAVAALIVASLVVFVILISALSGGETNTTKADAGPKQYRIRSGDTLSGIAEKQGTEVELLEELNPDIDPQSLRPGQVLRIR